MLRDTSGQDRVIQKSGFTNNNKWRLSVVVVALVVLGGFFVPRFNNLFASDMAVSKERLRFATVERGDLMRDISVQGRVVAANSPTLYVNTSGIVSLHIKAGDSVEQGQTVAIVDSPLLSNQLDQESATLEQLKLEVGRQKIQIKSAKLNNKQAIEVAAVTLDTAQTEKRRAEISVADSLISQREYEEKVASHKRAELTHKHALENYAIQEESMELELKGMQSQLERQQYVVNDLQRQIDELTLLAPTSGIVGTVYVREKDNVNANAPIITVIDLSALEIEAAIPENYADDLGVGLGTEISFNGETLAGTLVAISPEVQDGQVTGRIRFNQTQVQNLRQNQRVNARILIESKQDVLKLRRGAFVESGGGRIAYVVEQNNAFKRDVVLGARSIGEVEVISGLAEGEQVVISSLNEFNQEQNIYLTQ